jgi:hypothetical protein
MTPRRIHEFICLLRLRSPLAFLMARLQQSEKDVFFGQSRFWHCDLARLSMTSSADRRTSFSGQSSRGDCGLSRGSRLFLDRGRGSGMGSTWEDSRIPGGFWESKADRGSDCNRSASRPSRYPMGKAGLRASSSVVACPAPCVADLWACGRRCQIPYRASIAARAVERPGRARRLTAGSSPRAQRRGFRDAGAFRRSHYRFLIAGWSAGPRVLSIRL